MASLPKASSRLISLDVFRGITIILMIVVDSPGNPYAYSWLQHADWEGCALADLVFPFFIVILGISASLTLAKQQRAGCTDTKIIKEAFKRALFLFSLGLLLNAFPHFHLATLRIPGVLQRISICYLISTWLTLKTRPKTQLLLAAIILTGYWLLLKQYSPQLIEEAKLSGLIDNFFLGGAHLYRPNFDPEGMVSTFPAIVTALIGNLAGLLLLASIDNRLKCF